MVNERYTLVYTNDAGKRLRLGRHQFMTAKEAEKFYAKTLAHSPEKRSIEPMRIIGGIGSRRRVSATDFKNFRAALLTTYLPGDVFVSGGCTTGGDAFTDRVHVEKDIQLNLHLPNKKNLDPDLLQTNPKAAYAVINFARNKLIARDADIMIAAVAPDRKGGTEDTIKAFRKKFGKTEKELIAEGRLILI